MHVQSDLASLSRAKLLVQSERERFVGTLPVAAMSDPEEDMKVLLSLVYSACLMLVAPGLLSKAVA